MSEELNDSVAEMSDEEFDKINNDYENAIIDGTLNEGNQVAEQPVIENQTISEIEVPVNDGDITLEQLENLLPEKEVEAINNTEQVVNDGNMNIALSQARQKAANTKAENELLKQRLDLLEREIKLSQVNNQPQVQSQVTDEQFQQKDVFEGLDLEEIPSIGQLKELFAKQQQQSQLQVQQTEQLRRQESAKQNEAKAFQMVENFRVSHGPEMGILSFDSIDNLFKSGRVKLSQGQEIDIQNAVSMGNDPAELYYDAIIKNVPVLKQKSDDEKIKKRIISNSQSNQQVTSTQPQPEIDNDFNFANSGDDALDAHLDELCEW